MIDSILSISFPSASTMSTQDGPTHEQNDSGSPPDTLVRLCPLGVNPYDDYLRALFKRGYAEKRVKELDQAFWVALRTGDRADAKVKLETIKKELEQAKKLCLEATADCEEKFNLSKLERAKVEEERDMSDETSDDEDRDYVPSPGMDDPMNNDNPGW